MGSTNFINIKSDILRYKKSHITFQHSFREWVELLLLRCGLHSIIVYRFGQFILSNRLLSILYPLKILFLMVYYVLNFMVKVLYGIEISQDAKIGKGFYIGHFGNIFVGDCTIGKNCSICEQTHIGRRSASGSHDSEIVIGDNVWVGSHSIIDQNVVVGSNSTISGGSIVKSDVRENCLVMGNPARVVLLKYDNSSLL